MNLESLKVKYEGNENMKEDCVVPGFCFYFLLLFCFFLPVFISNICAYSVLLITLNYT